ncbi:MAG: hypothetical protein WD097_03335 [Balneolales bacterium]
MKDQKIQLDRERVEVNEALKQGGFAKLKTYTRLAGPGWLQSALMLGGGSLAGSLYLGVLTGVHLIWLQPVAMILTIVMFGALSYVVLSTGKPPFKAINEHINPVLGWSWALASLASCMVWAMPQYALASGVIQQNLAPALFGHDGLLGDFNSRLLITTVMFLFVTSIAWQYSKAGRAVKTFEWILKAMIWLIVACFFGVVVRLSILPGGLDWPSILRGMIPDPGLFFRPADGFYPLLDAIPAEYRTYWSDMIVHRQREVMIAVVAAASGVNATFLLAYSLIRRKWGKEYRELAIFDLGTGMLIPFAIATTCVIIAGSNQFHAVPQPGFVPGGPPVEAGLEPSSAHINEFEELIKGRMLFENPDMDLSELTGAGSAYYMEAVSVHERRVAAALLTRDAFDLASSLEPLTGSFFARIIFGIGVLGMTLSTAILHMLISGMVVCEMLDRPHTGRTLRYGSLIAATGALGPFLWQKAAFWLAVPTSVFAFILLPSAYFTFFLMINKRELMGKEIPAGNRRILLNIIMTLIIILFCAISAYVIVNHAGMWGIAAVAVFLLAIAAGHFWMKTQQRPA